MPPPHTPQTPYAFSYDETTMYMPSPLNYYPPAASRNVYADIPPRPLQADPSARIAATDINMIIRQDPKEALLTMDGKEKGRKPVDPPPIVQLTVATGDGFLQSPYLFMVVNLWKPDKDEPWHGRSEKSLCGTLCSSLHRLKDTNNKTGGFFVFGDISVKTAGTFRLHFSLFDYQKDSAEADFLGSVTSKPFKVSLPKDFKGMEESTYLSRAFSDQGVRLRLRKEPRAFGAQKRGYSAEEDDVAQQPAKRFQQADLPTTYASVYPQYAIDGPQSPNVKRYSTDLQPAYPTTQPTYPSAQQTYPTTQQTYPSSYATYPTNYALGQYTNTATSTTPLDNPANLANPVVNPINPVNPVNTINPSPNSNSGLGLPQDIWWNRPSNSGPSF